MPNRIYLWEFGDKLINNPLENTNYLKILWILPTLWTEVKKRVLDLLKQKYNIIQKESLNPNLLADGDILKEAQAKILNNLYELEKITGESKSIVVFRDDCFTNKLLLKLLNKILWEENFERFVSVRDIDLSKPYNDEKFNINPNSLIIFWWSLNDTDTIDESYYTGSFAELIKILWDDFDLDWLNIRWLWICFWQQFWANLLWIKNSHSSSIIATYKWLAQFWPSNCSLPNYKYTNKIYQEALSWLSNFWLNNKFSTFFTRTWYADLDLLKTGRDSVLIPLIKDEITGTTARYGTKNWNILWIQFHPEISFFDDRQFLYENIESILPYLSQYKNYEILIENFNFDSWFNNIIQKDIWEHFYTFAILAFLKSIKEKYISSNKINKTLDNNDNVEIEYQEALEKLTKVVREKIDTILSIENPSLNDKIERLSFLKKIDESWRLLLNSRLDWKVNRWIEEVSNILGFVDLWIILEKQTDFLKLNFPLKKVYYCRDWGAWDGNLLRDLYSKYKGKDIIFYWVWDYVYFDIYPSLKLAWLKMWIPEDVIILLFEDFLEKYLKINDWNTYNKVKLAFEQTKLDHIHKIHNSSITWTDTLMSHLEWEHDLSSESIIYIKENYDLIEKLKKYIVDNFYSLFKWYFERIYISKFNDFDMDNSTISKVDFQVSIRATSHLDNREYMKIIYEYTQKLSNLWSIFIDNWVHRSYTGVPRLYELFNISKIVKDDTKFSLIYHENTNYFTSVIIEKTPYHNEKFFSSELKPWYKIVSLEEAYNSTFFQLEYFIRNFIVKNFKNYDVFWNFNEKIVLTLMEVMNLLKNNNTSKIKDLILNLINYIATNYKNDNIVYDLVDLEILEKYSILWKTLQQIISSSVYIPDWMNLDAKRKY